MSKEWKKEKRNYKVLAATYNNNNSRRNLFKQILKRLSVGKGTNKVPCYKYLKDLRRTYYTAN